MKIYLIRHAQTNLNGQKRYIGHTDENLSELGEKQAKAVSTVFAGKHIDIIYSSPLIRAKETAFQIAKEINNPPIMFLEGLKEIGFGAWEKLSYQEAYQRNPEINDWLKDPSSVQIPNGETWTNFKNRVESAFGEIANTGNKKDNICVISHSGPLRLILGNIALPQSQPTYIPPFSLAIYHGSITLIEKIDEIFSIRYINEACHLTQLQPIP